MDQFVMRHPETGGVGVVPESALGHHLGRGWLRVSEALSDEERLAFEAEAYADAPDLDAGLHEAIEGISAAFADVETKAKPAAKAPAKRSTTKEKE